ncbi:hypothetical protein IJJ08_03020 [bacterium]|nr:hypothetical protein [bacterium]
MKNRPLLIIIAIIVVIAGYIWYRTRDVATEGDTLFAQYENLTPEAYVGSDLRLSSASHRDEKNRPVMTITASMDRNWLYENRILAVASKQANGHLQAQQTPASNASQFSFEGDCIAGKVTVNFIVEDRASRRKKQLVVTGHCDETF